jgi:hypothetical protein
MKSAGDFNTVASATLALLGAFTLRVVIVLVKWCGLKLASLVEVGRCNVRTRWTQSKE